MPSRSEGAALGGPSGGEEGEANRLVPDKTAPAGRVMRHPGKDKRGKKTESEGTKKKGVPVKAIVALDDVPPHGHGRKTSACAQ